MTRRKGLFITRDIFVNGASGGVQACTAEYRGLIEAAGIDLDILPFSGDRRFSTRLGRRIHPSPYWRPMEPAAMAEIAGRSQSADIAFLFFNQVTLAPVAEALRRSIPARTRIVLLSHGLESTDLLNLIRARSSLPLSGRLGLFPSRLLASVVRTETETRAAADLVLTLSPFDTLYERWLGTRDTMMVPRTIAEQLLPNWSPRTERMGFVGTLDHAPNLVGLVAALEALDAAGPADSGLRIRVVGGPPALGAWLSERWSCVDYLGPLPDPDLRAEAATWTAFIHPIFGIARGCSTKLATALGWGIPIITTPEGRRGYEWRQGGVIEVDTPHAFVRAMATLAAGSAAPQAAQDVRLAAATSPTLHELAKRLAGKLDALAN